MTIKRKKIITYFLVLLVFLLAIFLFFYQKNNPKKNKGFDYKDQNLNMINPASQNCLDKGGQLEIRKKENGEYGVCIFQDNRQCEEWALFRNECPLGGVKITGYTSDQEIFCAISGHEVSGNKCVLSKEESCSLYDFYNQTCP